MALGSVAILPLSLGGFIFFIYLVLPLVVVGAFAGLGAAAAVAVLAFNDHRLISASLWRGRLWMALVGSVGAALAVLVLLLVWNGPIGPEWEQAKVQLWAAPVIVGAGLVSAANRTAVIRLLASNDIASRPVRVARWALAGGQVLFAIALARYFPIWLAEFEAEVAEEPHLFDHGPAIAPLIPALALFIASALGLLWPGRAEARFREYGSAAIAVSGALLAGVFWWAIG